VKKETNIRAFFSLVRLGIGHQAGLLPDVFDWTSLETLAEQQGLSAILVDGVDCIPENMRPPKVFLLQWIGETLQGYEYRYELYKRAIAELAATYNHLGYKMMVLKGYGCGVNWPKPEHRPCGDIDIWLFGKQKEADAALTKETGIIIDSSHHHHTVFYWRNFLVENHFDIVNVYSHQSNQNIEKVFKKLAMEQTNTVELYGETVYIPTPNFHALFLLKHAMGHFAAEGLTIRQILDWGFFVKNNSNSIDWGWLQGLLTSYGMKDLFDIFNAICVEDLGFNPSIFPHMQFKPVLKDRVLNEIISPEFPAQMPMHVFPRIIYKLRRWKGNTWKRKLCFRENMWVQFWTSVCGHILKPNSI